MYKLVILDMDGTLLTSSKNISEFNTKVLNSIKDRVKILLASERGFDTIKPYLEQLETLNSDNYTIAFNGGLIMKNSGEKLANNSIEVNNIGLLEEYIKENENCEWYYYTFTGKENRLNIENIDKYIKETPIYKIVCIENENTIKSMRNEMPNKIKEIFQITSSEPTRIAFIKKGITKLGAIKELTNTLNITQDEIIAMGDGENDIDMIEFAGCGVAMGNAPDEVKQVANYVTDTNENDGVGKFLEKFL